MIEYLLGLALAFFAFLLYHIVIKIYLAAYQFKKMDPHIKCYIAPFSGMLGVQQKNIELYGDSQKFMKDMIRDNPDQKAYLTNLGSKPFLILCDPNLVRELSLNPKKFRKFNLMKHSSLSYVKGIFFAEDDYWLSIRGIIRHSFSHDQLKSMIPLMNRSISTYVTNLQKKIE